MKETTQKKRGRKSLAPQDVKNVRFQLVFSQNQVNAVGGRENAYKLLKNAIQC
jgi:hypothetical protein